MKSTGGSPKFCAASAATTSTNLRQPDRPFNLAKMMVGSEGTLGVVLEAKLNLVPLPKAKAVLVVQFQDLLEALGATPLILRHQPSAVEVMDNFILDHTHLSPNLQRVRETFIEGDPGAILCIEFYDDVKENLPPRLAALRRGPRRATVSAIAISTRSNCRSRRASGICAKPRSGFR